MAKGYHVVVGLGKTGISCLRYLQGQGIACEIIDNRQQPPSLAEFQKEFPDVPVHIGDWHSDVLAKATKVVISPGVDPHLPEFKQLTDQGVDVIGDIELFMQAKQAPVIGITGSNAKGTVTMGLVHALQACGCQVLYGGNIGIPALELLQQPIPDFYVLELSSFQLETVPSLALEVGVILNISQDHLDRHQTIENYIHVKQRVYQCSEKWVINRDDEQSQPQHFSSVPSISFGSDTPGAGELGIRYEDDTAYLAYGAKNLIAANELSLKGQHNWNNMLAVLALGYELGQPFEPMLKALKSFKGLSYRCQWLAAIDGVDWYNDSKATNVGAACAALVGLGKTCKGKIILIAGGQGKGADFSPLQMPVSDYVRGLVLLGEDAQLLDQTLRQHGEITHVNSFIEAIDKAQQLAQPGDIVLLSPACASFDMFDNYEHRGAQFEQLVLERA